MRPHRVILVACLAVFGLAASCGSPGASEPSRPSDLRSVWQDSQHRSIPVDHAPARLRP